MNFQQLPNQSQNVSIKSKGKDPKEKYNSILQTFQQPACVLLHASVLAALLVNVQKGHNREMLTYGSKTTPLTMNPVNQR